MERISESWATSVVARVVWRAVETLESHKLSINRVIITEEILRFEMHVRSVADEADQLGERDKLVQKVCGSSSGKRLSQVLVM